MTFAFAPDWGRLVARPSSQRVAQMVVGNPRMSGVLVLPFVAGGTCGQDLCGDFHVQDMAVSPYAYVPHEWLAPHAPYTSTDRLVLMAFALYLNRKSWQCWPSVRSLAARTKLSRSTVQRSIKRLVALGVIVKIETQYGSHGQASNVYTFDPVSSGDRPPVIAPRAPVAHDRPNSRSTKQQKNSDGVGARPFGGFASGHFTETDPTSAEQSRLDARFAKQCVP